MDALVKNRIIELRRQAMPFFEKITTNREIVLHNFETSDRIKDLRRQEYLVLGLIVLIASAIPVLALLEHQFSYIQGFLLLSLVISILVKVDISRRITLLKEAKFLKKMMGKD